MLTSPKSNTLNTFKHTYEVNYIILPIMNSAKKNNFLSDTISFALFHLKNIQFIIQINQKKGSFDFV